MSDCFLRSIVEKSGLLDLPAETHGRIPARMGGDDCETGPVERVQAPVDRCGDDAPRESSPEEHDFFRDPSVIPAGWPEAPGDGCVRLDPVAVLRANPRSFALRVRGQSMANAGIYDGDIVVGEFTPEARPGAVVVALIDGESTLKRLVIHEGRPCLASENPNCPRLIPLSELVVQGVVHTVVRRVR